MKRMTQGSGPTFTSDTAVSLLFFSLLVIVSGCADDSPPIMGPGSGPHRLSHSVDSANYLQNRFFHLDLPPSYTWIETPDNPGRDSEIGIIDLTSIQVYKRIDSGALEPGQIANVAAFRDTSGIWSVNFSLGDDLMSYGSRWQSVSLEVRVDEQGILTVVDLLREHDLYDVLAVTYDVINQQTGELLYRIGDRPGEDEDQRIDLFNSGTLFYRMKVLKYYRDDAGPHVWQYALRNVYGLRTSYIDRRYFDLSIELKEAEEDLADLDENGLPWFQVFGLDRESPRDNEPDWIPDIHDGSMFDLQRGLLFFPLDMPTPFAAAQEQYESYAYPGSFDWTTSLLPNNLAPELYLYQGNPNQLYQYSHFRLVFTTAVENWYFQKEKKEQP